MVRGTTPTAQRFSTIFSTQGGLYWHHIVNWGLSCRQWGIGVIHKTFVVPAKWHRHFILDMLIILLTYLLTPCPPPSMCLNKPRSEKVVPVSERHKKLHETECHHRLTVIQQSVEKHQHCRAERYLCGLLFIQQEQTGRQVEEECSRARVELEFCRTVHHITYTHQTHRYSMSDGIFLSLSPF